MPRNAFRTREQLQFRDNRIQVSMGAELRD
jgi:hypothetical protein